MKKEHYYSFTRTEFPFDILTSGITTSDKHYIVEREKSCYYILEYVCEGSGTIICNNHQYTVNAGDAFILPKGSNHKYFSEDSWTKIWFNVDGSLVTNLIHSYNLEKNIVFRNFNNQKLFDDFYALTSSTQPTEDLIFSSALMFHTIIQKIFVSRNEMHTNMAYAIKKTIDKNLYQNKISIKEIAEQHFISQTTLIDIFKKSYQTTPYQYFTNKRISIAASLLLTSDASINDISDMLNYSDVASFSNAFKKNMGVSPKTYKKINSDRSSQITNFFDD